MDGKRHGCLAFAVRSVLAVIVGIALGLLIRQFGIGTYVIPSPSMHPTLNVGDMVIGSKLAYVASSPERGDIVVFENPEDANVLFIKRVIAVEGQIVDLVDGSVSIDGKIAYEPYTHGTDTIALTGHASNLSRDVVFPFMVPKGYVFVMGDNRSNSADSRYFGAIPLSSIEAKAEFRYYPFSEVGFV